MTRQCPWVQIVVRPTPEYACHRDPRRGRLFPRAVDVPAPTLGEGEALLRTLRVGIDGTDHAIIEGTHGEMPPGEEYQVLDHEAVGVVIDPNRTALDEERVIRHRLLDRDEILCRQGKRYPAI